MLAPACIRRFLFFIRRWRFFNPQITQINADYYRMLVAARLAAAVFAADLIS
jgi:hypothetical protein